MFSIIIPFYNRAQYLDHLVETLNAQSYQDFEVIFVDDHSDTTEYEALRAAVRRLNRPVILERLRANMGAGAARDAGMRLAKSDWIAFLDSDDIWSPHKLAWAAEFICSHPNCGVLSHDFSLVEGAMSDAPFDIGYRRVKRFEIIIRNISATPCLIVKKNPHLRYPHLRYNEDHIFLFKLILGSELEIYKSPLKLCCLGGVPSCDPEGMSSDLTRMRVGIIKSLIEAWLEYAAILGFITVSLVSMPIRHIIQLIRLR